MQNPKPQISAGPMADILAEILEDVALAIEEQMGGAEAINIAGGPYATSRLITYNKKLREAAAAALSTVVNHPKLKPKTEG